MPDMDDEKKEKAPATAPQPKSAAGPKKWKYVGPVPAPTISNLPRAGGSWRANELPQEYIPFVLETVPAARNWWE